MFYQFLKYVVLGPILKLFFRPWVEGIENMPDEGPAILASNHLSFSDSIFLPLIVPRRITFLAKADYFTGRGHQGLADQGFFKGVGQVPIDRSGGRASEAALRKGIEILGSRRAARHLPGGHPLAGRPALPRQDRHRPDGAGGRRAGHPGRHDQHRSTSSRPGKVMPRIMRVGIRIGEPLDFSRYEGMEGDRFVLRSITDEIMYELMQLSGQEYVDTYATKAKADIADAQAAHGGAGRRRRRTPSAELPSAGLSLKPRFLGAGRPKN